jgi:hypothetical protein
MPLPDLKTLTLPKNPLVWAGVVGLACYSAFQAFGLHDFTGAMATLGTAAGLLGIGGIAHQAATLAAQNQASVRSVQADVANIRDNPALPGTPTPPAFGSDATRSSSFGTAPGRPPDLF